MKNTMIKKTLLVVMSGMMIVGLCAFTGISPVKAATAAAGNPPANPPENPSQPQNVPQQEKPAGEPAPAVSPEPAPEPEPEPEPAGPQLSDSEIDGLKEAVRAGKDAVAMYQDFISRFGEQDAFAQNLSSLQQELAELLRLAEKYGIDVAAIIPDSPPDASTLDDALSAAARVEQEHASLFARLPADGDHSDLAEQYTNMKNASQNNHLPKLEQKP